MSKLILRIVKNTEEQGDYCYGHNMSKMATYTMAGGGRQWWSYIVEFNDDGKQSTICIDSENGRKRICGQGTLWCDDSGNRLLLSVDKPEKGEWTELVNYD